MEADGPADTKTRERTEGAATTVQSMHGDNCTAKKVRDGPKTSTSFGMKLEPPALPYRDEVLVENGDASPKSYLSPVEMRKSTSAGGLLHAGSASTNEAQGSNFPPQLISWSFRETSEKKNIGTTRQTFTKYNCSWHPKVIETKSGQNLGFDPARYYIVRLSVRLHILGGRRTLYHGGLIREAFATRYSHLCFFLFS